MLAVWLLLLAGAASSLVDRTATPLVSQQEWQAFKLRYNKSYADDEEDSYRMKVYSEVRAFVDRHMREHAAGLHTYTVDINQFADRTPDEWRRMVTKGAVPRSSRERRYPQVSGGRSDVPDTMDWRDRGAVTPVIDQGQCGSSWAFSATGGMEGAWVAAGNPQVTVSAQELMDCTLSMGNYGCSGGWMDVSFDYVRSNGGIDTAEQYPYEAEDGRCRSVGGRALTVSAWFDIPEDDEDTMKVACGTSGPISTAVDATPYTFAFYSGGVYYDPACSAKYPNHGTLVVGYGLDHWIVKNTWGPDWGEDGFIRIYRNGSNICGLASTASYPVA